MHASPAVALQHGSTHVAQIPPACALQSASTRQPAAMHVATALFTVPEGAHTPLGQDPGEQRSEPHWLCGMICGPPQCGVSGPWKHLDPAVHSAELQHSSFAGSVHDVASATGYWQTRNPPGESSTQCPFGGQSASASQSPEFFVIAPVLVDAVVVAVCVLVVVELVELFDDDDAPPLPPVSTATSFVQLDCKHAETRSPANTIVRRSRMAHSLT